MMMRRVAPFTNARRITQLSTTARNQNSRFYSTSKYVLETTEENFERDVLKSNVPVLLDVYANWCGPCKMIAPVLTNLAEEHAGKFVVVKVNADDSADLLESLKVEALPTLLGFKNGSDVGKRLVGAHPKPVLAEFIKDHLLN